MPKVIIEIAKGANADQVLAALKAQLGGVADSISLVSENTKRLEKEQRKAEGAFKSVASSLDPVIRKSLEYERSQRALDEALKRNIISEAEHSRLLGLAKTRYQEATNASVSFAQRSQNAIGGLLGTLGKAQFLIGGLGALGAGLGLGAAIEEAREAQREVALLDAQMANLPATSSITAAAVKQHAAEIGAAFAFDAEEVIRAERGLIRYGVTSEQVLRQASELSADVARSLGIGLTEAAAMVGKALQEPGEGMKALKAAGLGLSDQQIELAKHLAETGQASEAQRQVISSLRTEVEGTAAAYRDSFDGALEASRVAVGDLAEGIGTQLLPHLADLLNALTGIGGNSAAAQTLQNIGSALGGILGVGSQVVEILNRIGSLGDGKVGKAFTDFTPIKFFGDALGFVTDQLDALGLGADRVVPKISAVTEAQKRAAAQDLATAAVKEKNIQLTGEFQKALERWTTDAIAANAEAEKQERTLQSLLDTLDPVSAIYRKLGEDEDTLRGYFERANVPIQKQNELLATLAGRAAAAAVAAGEFGTIALQEIKIDPESLRRQVQEIAPEDMPVELHGRLTMSQDGVSEFEKESDAATERFAANMEAGLVSAGETFFMELMQGGDDAWEHLGENLTQVLVQSVAEWLTAQLAAIARAAAAAAAVKLGGGGTSGVGPVADGSQYASMLGGGGGMGGMSTFMIGIAAFAAAVAMFKHQSDRHDAVQFGTVSGAVVTNGAVQDDFQGRLDETGAKVSEAIGGLLSAFQEATGSFIQGTATAEIEIRNDKEAFRAIVNGVLIGEFKDVNDAIIAAAKGAFLGANLSQALDPAIEQVIRNFDGSDPKALLEAISSVRGLIDEVQGLTEIEIALRDLPAKAAATAGRLMEMGIAFDDANRLAGEWQLHQLQNLRDQITGHEQSAAEEMAERQRQAAMFNAQVTLMRAETQLKRDEIAARVAALEASGALFEGQAQLDIANLSFQRDFLMNKASLYDQEAQVQQWYLDTMGVAANASLLTLQAQLAAFDAMLENLPSLIDPGEIRLPGRRGGGGGGNLNVDTGPSEAEQRVLDFEAFLEQRAMVGLSSLQQRLAELDAAYAEQAQAASEVAGGEERLAAARAAELAALREELIDGLSLPMESARDRFRELAEVLQYLRDTTERTAESSERYTQVLSELTDQANRELLGIAADLAETMGLDSDAAELRLMMAEAEWDLKVAEFQFLFMQYSALGLISDEVAARLKIIFEALNDPANRPDFSLPDAGSQGGSSYDNGQDEALQAQQDLISALEDLADLQRELWASNLSPLNAEQQTQFLAGQLQDAYNQAQASGNADDVRAFQDLVRDYLSSYQDAYGSTGGYTSEFLRINDLINNLLAMGNIGGVVPGPGMLGGNAGTGTGGWRPTPGANGTVVPFERTGGPGSPLVVESPALTAIVSLAAETNRRLAALEAGIGGLSQVAAAGNEAAAARAFTAGRTLSASQPRFQKRGA